ncbi:MAG: glycoside hydrolase family 3 C-terminal domain-containing protein [Deltaproteobacteria bacterium]|nr:glycoside hydrolase family 3 C-terminal domain-containing protein [Deltaproteobacteria bacterium]
MSAFPRGPAIALFWRLWPIALFVFGSCGHPETQSAGQGDAALIPYSGGFGGPSGAEGQAAIGASEQVVAGSGGASVVPAEEIVPGDSGAEDSSSKMPCGDAQKNDPWVRGYTPDPAVVSQAESAVASMSLTERADQMRGTPKGSGQYSDIFRTLDNSNKGIRGIRFRDGPRGLNLAAELPEGKSGYSTAFPVPAARGAAFDMDLEYRIGVAIGDETLASGNTLMLAPTVNILRHPAWGRAQETYGEDPYLLGRLGTAFVIGVQEYIPACAKHYAANNIENGRASANADMDEQTLREVYTRHFEMIVRDGGVACIMASYNLVNGMHSTQNKHLLTEILRDGHGFKGFVITDWWAMPGGRDVSTDAAKSFAAEAVLAGLDMELPWALNYLQLESVTGSGRPLSETDVKQAASRILQQKFRFKIAKTGEQPGLKRPTTTFSGNGSIENNAGHIALAREAALKSMVLLKNDNNTLPIRRDQVKTVAVIGANVTYTVADTNDQDNGTIDFATSVRLGDLGSSRVFADPAKSTGPAAGIRQVAGAGINVVSGADAALASSADFVVVVAGLTPEDEGEEYTRAGDRANFALDGKKGGSLQNNLISAVAQKGKPMVVVLEAGSVVDMPWLSLVPAVVMAFYPGMDGGSALGELLFGDVNFSGKLPVTWPKRWEDEPLFSGGTTTAMQYDLGYRYFDRNHIEPLFSFGHGLSYTRFEYKNLRVPCSEVTKGAVVDVSVEVTNSGAVAGDEIVLLFVSYPGSSARRPVKELKGFYRVSLEPGQTKRVSIPLSIADLKFWDMASNSWQIESGQVQVMVGPSASQLPLYDTFTVK